MPAMLCSSRLWLVIALAGSGWGCERSEAPKVGAPAPATAQPTAPTGVEAEVRALADALGKAPTVDRLHRDFVDRLPAPDPDTQALLTGLAADTTVGPTTRLAALATAGALASPERTLALRNWLNEAIKLPADPRPSSLLAVRLMTTLHDPLLALRAALPAAVGGSLPSTSPGERTAWRGTLGELALEPPTAADVPVLIRLALSDQAASPRMAWLMLAALDAPAATEALLWLPAADLGEAQPGPGLTGWALALHAGLPGARERLKAAMSEPGRGGDRAIALLTWLGDPAARQPAAQLLDRLAQRAGGVPIHDFDLATFIEGAGRLAADATADDPLALALARYGDAGGELSRRAHSLAGPAGVSADRDKLFDMLAADPSEPRVRRALLPLLRAEDAPRLAALLARDRWGLKGFFHHVRMIGQAPAAVLTEPVVAALVAVAGEHPEPQTREWAFGALAQAGGPLPAVVTAAAAKGSKAATRTLVTRAEGPWDALWTRISGDDDPVRRAAYEMLIAPRLLPIQPTAEQWAQVLDQIARHLTARPEEPWVFLRAARHAIEPGRAAMTPAAQKALARAMRPYCVTSGPDGKPWWDALFTVASMDHPDARQVVADAVKSVPTAAGRAVMRERLGLPVDPNDALPTTPTPEKRGGHWSNPTAPGGLH